MNFCEAEVTETRHLTQIEAYYSRRKEGGVEFHLWLATFMVFCPSACRSTFGELWAKSGIVP